MNIKDMGTTGLIDFVLSSFKGTWQRYNQALAIVRQRTPMGALRFPAAVAATVSNGKFGKQYVTRVLRYTNGGAK